MFRYPLHLVWALLACFNIGGDIIGFNIHTWPVALVLDGRTTIVTVLLWFIVERVEPRYKAIQRAIQRGTERGWTK